MSLIENGYGNRVQKVLLFEDWPKFHFGILESRLFMPPFFADSCTISLIELTARFSKRICATSFSSKQINPIAPQKGQNCIQFWPF